MSNTYVVILAGGAGTRFWPHSREDKPKQFLDVLGTGRSLLQMTFDRFAQLCPAENILISTNEKYEDLIKEQLPQVKSGNILFEPVRRNTAPAILYAAVKINSLDPDAVMVSAHSDHAILDEQAFQQVATKTLSHAGEIDGLFTIGVKPTRPDTGYGYIQYQTDTDPSPVLNFEEKPDLTTAQRFFESGDYLWNSGIFIWQIKAILHAFEQFLPDTTKVFEKVKRDLGTEGERLAVHNVYSQAEDISIDHGIMEKAENVFVVPGDFGWSDVGSWNSLHDIRKKDSDLNVLDGNVVVYDSNDCMVKGPGDKLIVVEGLEGYVIADHGNALLICKKENEKKIKDMVVNVRENNPDYS